MNLTKPQVEAAIAAGLAVTDPESETLIAMKYAPGLLVLRGLLQAIAQGSLALKAVEGMAPGAPPPPPAPNASKKTSKKKASKKKASKKRRKKK